MTGAAAPARLGCRLEAGQIAVEVARADLAPAALFGFAERNNPRRAFLFVSRVLGRHVPVAPRTMRATFAALAAKIGPDLPGPVLMTGMAETAVGLGAGVHDAWLAATGRRDALYLATTRHRLGPVRARFEETHSHASGHLVHLPAEAGAQALLAGARSVVMVDDEASSGDTFANLLAGLRPAGLERVVTAVLTDWSDGARLEAVAGCPVSRVALLEGRFDWQGDPAAPPRRLPDPDIAREEGIRPLARPGDARLGRTGRLRVDAGPVLAAYRRHAGPVHVLGTGEHVWEPFLIAEALEAAGHAVTFSATTRSPILPGHAIRSGLRFRDHEGLGIANYLYNLLPEPGRRVLICLDTALEAVDPRLVASFRADILLGDALRPFETLPAGMRAAPPLVPERAGDMT